MKLYATDQISITAVQPDSLRPGQEFEVSDDYGNELLEKRPNHVSKEPPKKVKAEAPPKNKMEQPPSNKARGKRRG